VAARGLSSYSRKNGAGKSTILRQSFSVSMARQPSANARQKRYLDYLFQRIHRTPSG
jgi:hypothetical protein